MEDLSPAQRAVLRSSFAAEELAEAVADLSYDDRQGLLQADPTRLMQAFTDEERNTVRMATNAVIAFIRVNPREHD